MGLRAALGEDRRYVGKIIHVNAGHALSLQYHNLKDETIYLHSGKLLFEIQEGDELVEREMLPGECVHITPKTVHRMTAIEDSDIFEVSTPELHDVVRLDDRYGQKLVIGIGNRVTDGDRSDYPITDDSIPDFRREYRRPSAALMTARRAELPPPIGSPRSVDAPRPPPPRRPAGRRDRSGPWCVFRLCLPCRCHSSVCSRPST